MTAALRLPSSIEQLHKWQCSLLFAQPLRETDTRAHPAILLGQLELACEILRHQCADDLKAQAAAGARWFNRRMPGAVVTYFDGNLLVALDSLNHHRAALDCQAVRHGVHDQLVQHNRQHCRLARIHSRHIAKHLEADRALGSRQADLGAIDDLPHHRVDSRYTYILTTEQVVYAGDRLDARHAVAQGGRAAPGRVEPALLHREQ